MPHSVEPAPRPLQRCEVAPPRNPNGPRAHHHAASRATIQATAERHDELLREFQRYFGNAASKPQGEYKSYVIGSGTDPGQLRPFTQYLDRNQIHYGHPPNTVKTTSFNNTSHTPAAVPNAPPH